MAPEPAGSEIALPSPGEIASRYEALRQRIDQSAHRSERSGSEIDVLAVTKTHPPALVRAAHAAGLRSFGENYVQEALAKQDELGDLADIRWHLIGHLQSNKTNAVAGRFALIESVDSVKLGRRIAAAAQARGQTQDVLVQIKLGIEETKSGAVPSEIPQICDELGQLPGLHILGLMAIAPLGEDGFLIKEPRPYFAQAKAIFDRLPPEQRRILSMGMSADFEAAIEEGSTLIRVGTTLFGHRPLTSQH